MSDVRTFTLGAIPFRAVICTDPATGTPSAWVYRTDVNPPATVATGKPDYLRLTATFESWDVAVLETAMRDAFEDAPA